MQKVAFLTMNTLLDFVCDDELAYEPLSALGWLTEAVPWHKPAVNWNEYDAVVIRSTWDYQNNLKEFLETLSAIDQSEAHLENSLDIVRWNVNKTYLRDLARRGVGVVPTIYTEGISREKIIALLEEMASGEIILKPVISANADHTYRVRHSNINALLPRLEQSFRRRPYLAQPFMENIIREGEYSLFFFGGEYSHTILKTPKKQDFRVQEEHGGIITAVHPLPSLKAPAEKAIAALKTTPLYARVDLVRKDQTEFLLMELELIEPALYFRMDADAPGRFAQTLNDWMQAKGV